MLLQRRARSIVMQKRGTSFLGDLLGGLSAFPLGAKARQAILVMRGQIQAGSGAGRFQNGRLDFRRHSGLHQKIARAGSHAFANMGRQIGGQSASRNRP